MQACRPCRQPAKQNADSTASVSSALLKVWCELGAVERAYRQAVRLSRCGCPQPAVKHKQALFTAPYLQADVTLAITPHQHSCGGAALLSTDGLQNGTSGGKGQSTFIEEPTPRLFGPSRASSPLPNQCVAHCVASAVQKPHNETKPKQQALASSVARKAERSMSSAPTAAASCSRTPAGWAGRGCRHANHVKRCHARA